MSFEQDTATAAIDPGEIVAGYSARPVTSPCQELVALAFQFELRNGRTISACLPRDICFELIELLKTVADTEWSVISPLRVSMN